MRRVLVLGSTGSIGMQALDVIFESLGSDDPLQLVGLASGSSWQEVLVQTTSFDVKTIYLADLVANTNVRGVIDQAKQPIRICASIKELIEQTEPDIVLNAIVGFEGLQATLTALEYGVDVALANKESLVSAGTLCLATARSHDALIIPVDSEHSALQQCLAGSKQDEIERLVLTASGGPFRGLKRDDLMSVTVDQALNHPTWTMGSKISIDSATLMNKGLELIEAMVLFEIPQDRIEVVVHPHSIVHALVRHRDQSLIAHLGWPDMRVPIAWALHYPSRPKVASAQQLDLTQMPSLTFEEPDLATFRCLSLARDAAKQGEGAPCVLNAANEIAVEAFLAGRIGFLSIADVVDYVLSNVEMTGDPDSFEQAQEIDAVARRIAHEQILKTGTRATVL